MENAGSWTVSGSKETMEVPKNFKDLRKLGVRNIAQYSTANLLFPPHSLFSYYRYVVNTDINMACGPPEKPSLALVPRLYVHA